MNFFETVMVYIQGEDDNGQICAITLNIRFLEEKY